MQSARTLQDLLRETQAGWQKTAADLLTITASNEKLRVELASSVGSSVFVAEQSTRSSVQSLLTTEQAMVSKLRDNNSELRRELREWEEQYDWQAGATAGANGQPLEPKSAAPRRLDFEGVDAEEAEEDAQRAPRQPRADAPPHQTQGSRAGTPQRDEGVSPASR